MSILTSVVADVRPFTGLRYEPNVVGSLSDVLCPPYDIIPEALQRELHLKSPYNAVRLERGMASEGDGPASNLYTRAAEFYTTWRQQGILVRDHGFTYYLHRHQFSDARGKTMERWGIGARVRLEEFERGVILPHEETRSADKADRLALIEVSRANFSPVMALYRQGPERRLSEAINSIAGRTPIFDGPYEKDQHLTLWLADTHDFFEAIHEELQDAPLFIADGHHRYETALKYRNQLRDQAESWSGEEACNFVMMTLIDFDDLGLLVQPYHRVVGGLRPSVLTDLRKRLHQVFRDIPLQGPISGPEALEDIVARYGQAEPVIGLLQENMMLPQLVGMPGHADNREPTSAYEALHRFEGWVLHQEVFNRVLGSESVNYVDYTHDPREAWEMVASGTQQMAFFLRPMPMETFELLVSAGMRLPPKSTYFYPKIPTGLVFHSLDG